MSFPVIATGSCLIAQQHHDIRIAPNSVKVKQINRKLPILHELNIV